MEKAPEAFRTISEVAEDLDLPQHVLRFWESRFAQIRPMKRAGGRRYYRPDDVALLRGIRHLLYGQGYTIRGVQRILRERGLRFVQTAAGVEPPQPMAGDGAEQISSREDGEDPRADSGFGRLPSGPEQPSGDVPECGGQTPEPTLAPAPTVPAKGLPAQATHSALGRGLPADALTRLQTVADELVECRSLLNRARQEQDLD